MNAARRAIISDMRHRGMSGKEAYEATKDPEIMAQWIRVTISNRLINGKPKLKVKKPPSWRNRLRLMKQMEAIQLKNLKKKRRPALVRAWRIQQMLEGGFTLDYALKILKRHDAKQS